jgi:hypothetical protein
MLYCETCKTLCTTGVIFEDFSFQSACEKCMLHENNREFLKNAISVKVTKTKVLNPKKKKAQGGEKKPRNSYNFFMSENRERIKQENPELVPTELNKKIAADWKTISPEDKEKYTKLAQDAKEEYLKSKA